MRLIAARYVDGDDFLSCFDAARGAGVLCVRTRAQLAAGEAALLEVEFAGLPSRMVLRATVHKARGEAPILAFQLLLGEEATRDFVLAAARGLTPALRRVHLRLPIHIPTCVEVHRTQGPALQKTGLTDDVGPFGVKLRTPLEMDVGSEVRIEIDLRDHLRIVQLPGVIAWHRQEAAGPTYGVHFPRRLGADFRRYRTTLRKIYETGRSPSLR